MKRLMMTIAVVVVLLGISDKALAQSRWLNWCFTGRSFGGYGRGYSRGEYIYLGTPARSRWLNWTSTRGRYGGRYGYYGSDKTLSRVTVGRGIVRDLHEMSMDNELLGMAKEEQKFKHELIREEQAIRDQQIRAQNNTVLRTKVPIRRITKIKPNPKKTQTKTTQTQNEELRQEVEALKVQLAKIQQELQKEAKK